MRAVFLILVTVTLGTIGCDEDSERPLIEEVYLGKLEVEDLEEPNPEDAVRRDSVRFAVKGTDYRLDHLTDSTGLCSSGGEIGGFGTNRVILTPVFTIPAPGCDSARIPKGEFKAAFDGNKLTLGPDTLSFTVDQLPRDYSYTLRLSK